MEETTTLAFAREEDVLGATPSWIISENIFENIWRVSYDDEIMDQSKVLKLTIFEG